MKNSNSTALRPVPAGEPPATAATGGCGGATGRSRMKWMLAGGVALAVAAALLGSGWVGLAAVLPFLYLLPCLAMAAMCMKGMAKKDSGGRA